MAPALAFSDRYGLPLTTRSATAARSYVEGVDRHLSRSGGARQCFETAIAADPAFALAHAALAGHAASDDRGPGATAVAARLRDLAIGATRWEGRHIELVAALLSGHVLHAALLTREQLAEFPRDVLALQRAIVLIENGGRRDWPRQRLALLERVAAAYGDDWYFLGAHARAHQEVGRLDEARCLAERALAGNPQSANAAHALAHVLYEADEHASGRAFMDEWLTGYDPCAPYRSHLAWHLALFELAQGSPDRALSAYERHTRSAGESSGRGRLLDSASLLWRCHLAGRSLESLPWKAVCRVADHWTGSAATARVAAHAALAYAAIGETAALARLVDDLRRRDATGESLAGSVVLPLVQGIAAFAAGAYDESARSLEPIADDLVRLGGSRAQRQVFEDTRRGASLRAGRCRAGGIGRIVGQAPSNGKEMSDG